jgi:hypothetical protein
MKNLILSTGFAFLFGAAAWHSLTTTLDQMTARDCQAGVVKACEALQ